MAAAAILWVSKTPFGLVPVAPEVKLIANRVFGVGGNSWLGNDAPKLIVKFKSHNCILNSLHKRTKLWFSKLNGVSFFKSNGSKQIIWLTCSNSLGFFSSTER